MKLSRLAIDILRMRPELRQKIAQRLNVTDQSVKAWRRNNDEDGPLTRAGIVDLIMNETGLLEDQILCVHEDTAVRQE